MNKENNSNRHLFFKKKKKTKKNLIAIEENTLEFQNSILFY